MNLGNLVSIGKVAAKNLIHGVCENSAYETVGAVPIAGPVRISFTGMARAAGYPKTYEVEILQDWGEM